MKSVVKLLLKRYLGSPQLLSRLEAGERLQLYLAISDVAVSSVCATSRSGGDTKTDILSRKLKPYFESNPIQVVTDQPLKRVLSNPAFSGRLTTWAIELSEFEISYVSRTSVRAQALVDFVTECTARPPPIIQRPRADDPNLVKPDCVLYVDVARNDKGAREGVLIMGPQEETMEYALQFNFSATNNEVEYEAMIIGLKLFKSLGVDEVLVRGDSKLVIDQVRRYCGVKNEVLMRYHTKAVEISQSFKQIIFEHIPKVENEKVDRLSRLATTYYSKLSEGVKSWDDSLLTCVSTEEVLKVLAEVHEGWCESHIRTRSLAIKITRVGYYWPTLVKDETAYVKRCDAC
ncbi:hypothetical protein LIER_13397 [Lithospermum erythrorhizon]|uniref:RNase H type-1 domain-containing protein n=1 Tax=Lithospermum erythrorhizon TaxID=34254 RepID=A0AAV3PWV5_LITER